MMIASTPAKLPHLQEVFVWKMLSALVFSAVLGLPAHAGAQDHGPIATPESEHRDEQLTNIELRAEANRRAWNAYHEGKYGRAYEFWKLLAEQGDDVAQMGLGLLFSNGKGVPMNRYEAFKWYSLAARQGNTGAQLNLGSLYAEGLGVPTNYVLAYAWFSVAKANGEMRASKNLDTLISIFTLTPEQIYEGQKRSMEIWQQIEEGRRAAPTGAE